MKPSNREDLTEVITAAEFHSSHCNPLAYSSSRGSIQLVDLWQSAVCDDKARILQNGESGLKSFWRKFSYISDFKLASDEKHQNFHPILRLMHAWQYAWDHCRPLSEKMLMGATALKGGNSASSRKWEKLIFMMIKQQRSLVWNHHLRGNPGLSLDMLLNCRNESWLLGEHGCDIQQWGQGWRMSNSGRRCNHMETFSWCL